MHMASEHQANPVNYRHFQKPNFSKSYMDFAWSKVVILVSIIDLMYFQFTMDEMMAIHISGEGACAFF